MKSEWCIMKGERPAQVFYSFISIIAVCVFVSMCIFTTANAQNGDLSLEETLEQLAEVAARSYAQPVTDAFGINLNGGWFHRAPKPKIKGFDIEIGVVAMGSFLEDGDKRFSTSGPYRFTREQAQDLTMDVNPLVRDAVIDEILSRDFTVSIIGPTAIGSESENVTISFSGADVMGETIPDETFVLEGISGLKEDLDILPFAAPQLTIGTILGTTATIRWVPDIEIDEEIGKLKYFGFGIQHNLQSWIKYPMPVDLSLGYFTQTLEIGDIMEATTSAFGIMASKQLGGRFLNLTPYAGYLSENSKMDITYDYEVDTPTGTEIQNVAFELKGKNENRTIIGLSLRLGIFNFNADYNFGEQNSVTGGIMLGI